MLNGYRLLLRPGHVHAMTSENWDGYVYEHLFVAEGFLGRPLSDEEVVHHLDGDRSNNRAQNLLVLLRSQHSKLHAWLEAGAPYGKPYGGIGLNSGKAKAAEQRLCDVCKATLQGHEERYCSNACRAEGARRVPRPSKEQLDEDINKMSWLAVGRKYGVSDNAVRKWARAYGLLCQS